MDASNFICRVCLSKNVEEFKINHYGFPGKNENWKRSIFFFIYGLVDLITLKLFKISLIGKLFKQK